MKRRLGILLTHPIQYYVPWFRHLAGRMDIEVFYMHRQDAKGQAAAGFGVEFTWDLPLLEGYSSRWLKNIAKQPTLRSFWGCDVPEISQIVDKEKFDAFLIFGWNYKGSQQAIRACWRKNIPVLMRGDSHLKTKRPLWISLPKYPVYKFFLPKLFHLYVGQRNKEYLMHYGVPEKRLFFVPHFIDNTFFSRAIEDKNPSIKIRRDLGIPEDAFVYLFVGKFISKKRPEDFIRACLQLFSSEKNVHAILVGDGPLRQPLQDLVQSYSNKIHFARFRNQTEMPHFYAASNALVLPSDAGETWGLVVNEAFACGIPAIVSDAVGCAPDMIEEEKTGCTFPLGNAKSLAERMSALRVLCETQPQIIRRDLEEKNSYYSIEKATQALQNALEIILAKG
ncbi:MAG: glycosyltransferase family 4 protein [Chlamydiae bacterium]|nr:glycosyltransferase family 4 protein [Chlamydiota bacterium]